MFWITCFYLIVALMVTVASAERSEFMDKLSSFGDKEVAVKKSHGHHHRHHHKVRRHQRRHVIDQIPCYSSLRRLPCSFERFPIKKMDPAYWQ